MWLKWLPWRYLASRAARSHGLIDPVAVFSKLQAFAQPAEVSEPIELLRAGLIFQARGFINTRAIQHNLDWVWPYWIERQFDPRDPAFIPRAFSVTHVNLTHRNWTAIGVPDDPQWPLVDPRGLVTPRFDGWSLDAWLIPDEGAPLLPSQAPSSAVKQALNIVNSLSVETHTRRDDLAIKTLADVAVNADDAPECRWRVTGEAEQPGWLVLALRPANPEGVSFIHELRYEPDTRTFHVERDGQAQLSDTPERVCMSRYRDGDVLAQLPGGERRERVACDVGLGTGAALYRIKPGAARDVEVRVPLTGPPSFEPAEIPRKPRPTRARNWDDQLADTCRIDVPDGRIKYLFDAAVRNLILFSPTDVYPGPYTSKRFWFRDAAFFVHALLNLGLTDRAERVLQRYPYRQKTNGFFHSQEGEWDSNGQALWILDRFRRLTGKDYSRGQLDMIEHGARWIAKKLLRDDGNSRHAGLLPAGFSAEHLGPNDHYYWDDFWSVAGLRAAAATLRSGGRPERGHRHEHAAQQLSDAIDRSIQQATADLAHAGVPASPYRRMDAGCIGSLAAGYPGQVWAPRDERLLATADFLFEHCTVHGGFFQDVIHSGINAYLSLHLAEVLLRAGDARHWSIVEALRDLASPTGQWPEAIHPATRGGCMGDGQHMWAASEWALMLRNCFVREEADELILGSGLPQTWLAGEAPMRLGPTPTPYGPISVEVAPQGDEVEVSWRGDWRRQPPPIAVQIGDEARRVDAANHHSVRVPRPRRAAALAGASA